MPVQERAVCDLTCYFMQYLAWGSKGGLLVPRGMNPDVPPEAVVVLSGSPRRLPDGTLDEHSPENVARVQWGAQVALEGRLPLYLCGATEQLEPMMEIGRESLGGMINPDFAAKILQLKPLDAGPRETANTPTQFQAIAELGLGSVVAGTSGYHGPRALLTALVHAPNVCCAVSGVPYDRDWRYDPAMMVAGEIGRIVEYSGRGDIADPGELPPLGPFDSLP